MYGVLVTHQSIPDATFISCCLGHLFRSMILITTFDPTKMDHVYYTWEVALSYESELMSGSYG